MNTTETLEQFTERMSQVERKSQFVVNANRGQYRETFEFEGQYCHLETSNCHTETKGVSTIAFLVHTLHNPIKEHWNCFNLIYGKQRAKKIAKYYNAKFFEDYYPKESDKWFFLSFDSFENLMKYIYDINTLKFSELWGNEEKLYESCI